MVVVEKESPGFAGKPKAGPHRKTNLKPNQWVNIAAAVWESAATSQGRENLSSPMQFVRPR